MVLRELRLVSARVVTWRCCGFDELSFAADVYGFPDDARAEEEKEDLAHLDPEVLPDHPALETRELVLVG